MSLCIAYTYSLAIRCMIIKQCFFFFNDTATTEIYTLSLHDALPIFEPFEAGRQARSAGASASNGAVMRCIPVALRDRKSTRLNSSHSQISYAVFCLKKKKNQKYINSASQFNAL